MESELFGHEKGAFTGAVSQRIGKFEECDGGTLFLDEVGDMPLLMQSKVLRAIQEKEFQRVGGNQTIKSDVWIVAATNRDLDAMVAAGEFRADLGFRLNGYSIVLPPLRERRDDIPLLVEHYVRAVQCRNRQGDYRRRAGNHGTTEAVFLAGEYPRIADGPQTCDVARDRADPAAGVPSAGIAGDDRGRAAAAAPPSRQTDVPAAPQAVADPPPEHGDGCLLMNSSRSNFAAGPDSLYADSVKYMESILLTHVLRYTDGNQSQAAALRESRRRSVRNKLRLHGIMISSSIAIQDPAPKSWPPMAMCPWRPRSRRPASVVSRQITVFVIRL